MRLGRPSWWLSATAAPSATKRVARRARFSRVRARREVSFELLAVEVPIADQDQPLVGWSLAARDHLQAHALLVDLWGGQRERPGGAVHCEQGVQHKSPEDAGMAGAVAVVSGVGDRVAEAAQPATIHSSAPGASAYSTPLQLRQQSSLSLPLAASKGGSEPPPCAGLPKAGPDFEPPANITPGVSPHGGGGAAVGD